MEPIQDLLYPVAARLVRAAPLSPEKVACAWRMAVGPALARVSTPHLLDDGTMEARVDDARWQRELTRSRGIIVERLQSVLGEDVVRTLAVRGPAAPPSRGRRTPTGPLFER